MKYSTGLFCCLLAVGTLAQTRVIAVDPAGHGMLCEYQGKSVLMVSGTPAQMGHAHGHLLRARAHFLVDRFLYCVGAADTLRTGVWFFDRLQAIEKQTRQYTPDRFVVEAEALARAAAILPRDVRYANLLPERFHCTGVAVRGKATVGGQVLHARVLDYMRDINLQRGAVVVLFMPTGRHGWLSLGYAGMVGTVTAMNEQGLAVGEMGGRGEGQVQGTPMCYLLRDIMERAATVAEALAILRQAQRTCEYYYVFSDRSRAMVAVHCTPAKVEVLQPGQQHKDLPKVPPDTVFVSGGKRAQVLSTRLQKQFGKLDVQQMIKLIKRPVAMRSNLHNAIFAPEQLTMWVADASKHGPACNQPYIRIELPRWKKFYLAGRRQRSGNKK